MSERIAGGWALGLLCASVLSADGHAADLATTGAPDFTSAVDSPWMPTSDEYGQPESGPGPITYDHAHPVLRLGLDGRSTTRPAPMKIANLDKTNLKPWVLEYIEKASAEKLAGKIRSASRASCRPPGVPEFLVHGAAFRAMYVVQTSNEILLISDANMQFRHIYLNVPHSRNLTPSYFGESVGHFEGNEMVVDTIGFNDRTMLDDRYDVPHTTQLHVTERFKKLQDGKSLEADFTVDDPGAFNAPWSGVVRFRHPGEPRPFEEESCPEEAAGGVGQHFPVPVAAKSDF